MTCILLFLLGFFYDIAVVIYNNSILERRPAIAGLVSMGLGVAGLASYFEAFKGPWQAAALVLGYGVGTYSSTAYLKWRDERKPRAERRTA